jgi:hypothetical protein
MARPNTPPAPRPDGKGRIFTVKRHCNGCSGVIGDATRAEIAAAATGAPLPDARGECPVCTPDLEGVSGV